MSITRETAAPPPAEPISYPESDGRPMAETDVHRDLLVYFIEALQEHYRDREVYVSGNLLLYYVEGENTKSVSPDCLVALGLDPAPRRVYKTWEEGKVPDLVIEVTSISTKREDQGRKKRLYAQLGVRELWLVDPLGEYLGAPFQGYRLVGGRWIEIPASGERASSSVLGLDFYRTPQGVRLTAPGSEETLPSARELRDRLRARDTEIAALRAEVERLRSEPG
jgi:Uma2 family endonuclease